MYNFNQFNLRFTINTSYYTFSMCQGSRQLKKKCRVTEIFARTLEISISTTKSGLRVKRLFLVQNFYISIRLKAKQTLTGKYLSD